MATEFGTATNHADLVERLVQFLTAHPDLVAAGQAYEKVFDNTIPASGTAIAVRQVTLRAPAWAAPTVSTWGFRATAIRHWTTTTFA